MLGVAEPSCRAAKEQSDSLYRIWLQELVFKAKNSLFHKSYFTLTYPLYYVAAVLGER